MASFHNAVPKYPRSEGTATPLIGNPDGARTDAIIATGTTVPTDTTAGYAPGCVFVHNDGGAGTGLYVNEGTAASSDFNAALTTANAAVAAADGLTVGGVIVPQELEVSFHAQAAAAMVDQTFFVATQAYQVTKVSFVHAVAETTAATLLVQVTKDTSTNAPGAGTDLLTNNSSTGFNCKSTANTVQTGTLTATTADLQLAAGDRLSVDFSAAATELVGVTITVSLKRI